MFPGVLPNILLASPPTANTSPVVLFTATTDGSLNTIPFPFTYTITVAVPKSIPTSCPKLNISFPPSFFTFITFMLQLYYNFKNLSILYLHF